jgi:hypothetical protein
MTKSALGSNSRSHGPREGTRSGCLPFRERVAFDEPSPSPALPQSKGNVEVFLWIGGTESTSDILLQLVTFQTSMIILGSKGDVGE